MPRRSGFPANLPDHWIPAECQPGGEKQGVSVLMMDYQLVNYEYFIMNNQLGNDQIVVTSV